MEKNEREKEELTLMIVEGKEIRERGDARNSSVLLLTLMTWKLFPSIFYVLVKKKMFDSENNKISTHFNEFKIRIKVLFSLTLNAYNFFFDNVYKNKKIKMKERKKGDLTL